MSYKYDFFISYSRKGTVQKWLLTHFYKKLVEYLADECAPAPRVYMDRTMPRAVEWAHNLENSLRYSKIMIQLLTPPYFESDWCMAELESMHQREAMLGLAGSDISQGLIYPILYSDSDNFPDIGRMRSWQDFKEYAYAEAVYQDSVEYLGFCRQVRVLARDLVQLVQQVPPWSPDWPIVDRPNPVIIPPPPLPRFE
ncbi:TIR domain-containing protein [Lentzea sp. JNUCC 0626]|uniref:TIR domain-containing protein n=1 Tax=Lentzea sp. JNUCC 0626 TaxID=3367513 RepID=UPI0037481055